MTLWVVLGISAVLGLWAVRALRRQEATRARRLLDEAEAYERDAEYEKACYHYAIAAMAWHPGRRRCSERVRTLWDQHGPFTFEDSGAEMRATYCSCCESCGEGYHIGVVREVRRIIDVRQPKELARA